MEVTARIRYCRVGAQKARLVANLVRGKKVNQALRELAGQPKKTAGILQKLISTAVSNAESKQVMDVDNLYVKRIQVDQGPSMKRMMPRAQGRAFPIRKKTSHFSVVLDER